MKLGGQQGARCGVKILTLVMPPLVSAHLGAKFPP